MSDPRVSEASEVSDERAALRAVEALLAAIHDLLRRVLARREAVLAEAAALDRVGRDYDARLRAANDRADELDLRLEEARARLVAGPAPTPHPTQRHPLGDAGGPGNGRGRGGPANGSGGPSDEAPSAQARERRRDLVAHIRYFTPDAAIVERINAVLKEPERDIGDILEVLPWGDLWTKRAADWESPDDQRRRLVDWQMALDARLAYWERQAERQREDGRSWLLARQRAGTEADWGRFLDGLAQEQEARNERAAQELRVLEEELAARPAGRETGRG